MKSLDAFLAATACVATVAAVDVVAGIVLPGRLDPRYAVTLWCVSLLAGALYGLAVSLLGGSAAVAIAGWVTFEAGLHFMASPRDLSSIGKGGLLLSAGFALASFLAASFVLKRRRLKRTDAASSGDLYNDESVPSRTPGAVLQAGAIVGLALGLAVVALPELVRMFGPELSGFPLRAVRLLAFVLLLGGLSAVAHRRWARWLAPVTVAALLFAPLVPPAFSDLPDLDEGEPKAQLRDELPNIVLLILDTVRADHLSVYGYGRETTPGLARQLEREPEARLYPLAFSTSNWTIPAHASLFSGVMPTEHGAHTGNQQMMQADKNLTLTIRADETLAERLQRSGYRTAGVFANPYLGRVHGLERGFDRWLPAARTRALTMFGEKVRQLATPWLFVHVEDKVAAAPLVNEQVLEFVDECAEAPCFVFANYMDAHSPYLPARPEAGLFTGDRRRTSPRFARAKDDAGTLALAEQRYDEEIRYLDRQLSELLTQLRGTVRGSRTWVIIASDHGEAFMEHGVVFHGSGGHNEQVRIPLLIFPPAGVELPEHTEAVDLLDVTATLAHAGSGKTLGRGRNLSEADVASRPVTIEFYACENKGTREVLGQQETEYGRAVIFDGYKLMVSQNQTELYRLDDLAEHENLYGSDSLAYGALVAYLPEAIEAIPNLTETPLDPKVEEQLRSLGYLR